MDYFKDRNHNDVARIFHGNKRIQAIVISLKTSSYLVDCHPKTLLFRIQISQNPLRRKVIIEVGKAKGRRKIVVSLNS